MQKRDEAYLLDILIAARKVRRFTEGLSYQQFCTHEMVQSAVIREFQVIGEAVRLLSDEFKTTHPAIDWTAIIGMRNRLVHEYFDIRFDVVWQAAQVDIPGLIHQIEPLVPPDDGDE
jgi:uncharacterized protein with HEPN domain